MGAKPTYEELEQRVKDLERQVSQFEQVREDLVESEERFRSLVEASPAVIAAIRDRRFISVNPAGAKMLGFASPEEMVGMPAMNVVAPESQQLVAERIKRLEAGKENLPVEIGLIRQDGMKITVESSSVSIPLNGILTAVIIAHDISDKKKREEKLETMQFTVDHAFDRMAWIAPDGRFLYVNKAGYREMHFTREAILSMRICDVDPNFSQKKWNRHYQELKKAGSMRFQTSQVDGKGQTHYIDVSSNYIKFGEKEFICAIGRDITELKEVERKLKEAEERFRAFVDNIPASVYIKDENDRHIYGNQKAFESVGKKPEEFFGSTTRDLWPPQLADRLIELDRKVMCGKFPAITEEWTNTEAGDTRWRRDIKFPIQLVSGKRLLGGIAIDITKIKQTEELLKERLAFQALLTEISARFAAISFEDINEAIEESLAQIGKGLDIGRIAFIQFSEDQTKFEITYRYAYRHEYLPPLKIVSEQLPWFTNSLREGNILRISSIDDMPAEATAERQYAQEQGFKAFCTIPLKVGESIMGAISYSDMQNQRQWPDHLVDQLSLISQLFADALARAQAEEEVRDAFAEIRKLKNQLEQENICLQEEVELRHKHEEIIGQSESMKVVLSQAEQVAATESIVLILGETGTGKELLARAIHRMSSRRDRPMVRVNCAALPATLIESELFGRVKGAYTGALSKAIGRFELADGATIFLDEISEVPVEVQGKMLTVLQEGQFERVGSSKTTTVDVRVIAATNQDLASAVREGRFREDLYYRLNVFPISLPPLRERREDIPLLVWAFVREFGETMGKAVEIIPRKYMELLQRYSWPGNIRELKNVVERAMIICKGPKLSVDVPRESASEISYRMTLKDVEKHHITEVLKSTGWRVRGKNGAAEILGLKPTTLDSRIKRLSIQRRPEISEMS